MSRINTNIPSIIAQSNLMRNQSDLNIRLERLSTGLRINRGADDPAGLIISERIRSDISGIEQGIKNADRAASMISTTEASLAEVNELLNSIRALLVESANTGANSEEERRANQLQIDSAIDSITRISNTASFGGLRMLDGTLDYRLSGLATSAISIATIRNATLSNNAAMQVQVDVVASAQFGAVFYRGGTPSGVLLSAMTLEIMGADGVQEISFLSNTPLADVVLGVNRLSAFTGVKAELINNNANSGMIFRSTEFGKDAFVSVRRLNKPSTNDSFVSYKLTENVAFPSSSPTFPWSALLGAGTLVSADRDSGRDVSAVVNGILATGNGLELTVNSSALSLRLALTEDFATRPSASASNFYITGGGSLFQLGPSVTAFQQATFGIPSVAASQLGGTLGASGVMFLSSLKSGGANDIRSSVDTNDFTLAQNIVAQAIDEITELRGRLGAFERNVLNTNARSLQAQFENLTASESRIRDADFAAETSLLTRSQILVSANSSALQLANTQAQQVLQLLGG